MSDNTDLDTIREERVAGFVSIGKGTDEIAFIESMNMEDENDPRTMIKIGSTMTRSHDFLKRRFPGLNYVHWACIETFRE